MSEHPSSAIKQISTVLVPADDHPTLVTTALCHDGSMWTITRVPSSGKFYGWHRYPSLPLAADKAAVNA